MSQRELAARADVTETHISNVVNCQKDISVSFAKKLEYALAVEAGFWINLQANYDKELADFHELSNISSKEFDVLKNLKEIIGYMKRINIINTHASSSQLIIELRKLLHVSRLTKIPHISQAGAYRLAETAQTDPYILFTWLRLCDLVTEKRSNHKPLDIQKLKQCIPSIKHVMCEPADKIRPQLKEILAECGIHFLLMRHVRGAPVQGVIKKEHDGSLSLIMTNRKKSADMFWFTLFHEIGHIINDDIADKLIDFDSADNETEKKADAFAENTLIAPELYKQFTAKGDFSLDQINRFCKEIDIPSYMLIGRLQRDRYLEYRQYSTEKITYEFEDLEVFS